MSATVRAAARCETLIDLLRLRATENGAQGAFRFLPGEKRGEQRITYGELDRRARSLAVSISERTARGDRVLLLVPPGLDYIASYFACLYAGVIAVPAYPPNPRRPDARIPAIVDDCAPVLAITTAALLSRLESWRGDSDRLKAIAWLTVEDATGDSDAWK